MFIINRIARRRHLVETLEREGMTSTPMSQKRLGRNKSTEDQRRNSQSINMELNLTNLQKKALKLTWRRMNSCEKGSAVRIMEEVFNKIAQKSSTAHQIFFKVAFINGLKGGKTSNNATTIRSHAKLMVDLIDSIVFSLEDSNKQTMSPTPRDIGCAHAALSHYGFQGDLWECFGEIFLEKILKQECVQAYPHGKRSWTVLIASLTDILRCEFERNVAKNKGNRLRTGSVTVESDIRPNQLDVDENYRMRSISNSF